MDNWEKVGEVIKMQVHRKPLLANGEYRLDPLAEVSALRLTSAGTIGFDGVSWVLDSHHRHHPSFKASHRTRALSVGFSSHYEDIWSRFTPIPLGAGGENLIVSGERVITESDLTGGIRIGPNGSEGSSVTLSGAKVAEPCVPFTRLVTGRTEAAPDEIAADRECLRQGIRGYVMPLDEVEMFEVVPGTPVFIRSHRT
ncbi:MAG: hypothetical protein OXH33_08840 [bacterium]|nr:hypothetical protein [bacterium]